MWTGTSSWWALLLAVPCFTAAERIVTQQISEATVQFSLDLTKAVLHDQPGNVVLSPVSVYNLLAMLQQGARGNSTQELNDVLHASADQTKEGYHNLTRKYQHSSELTQVEFASRAFIRTDYNITQGFKQTLVDDFLSGTDSVNFANTTAASQHMNSWIAQETHNRITEFFTPSSLSHDTVLTLVNTIYFKSYWDHFFSDAENKTFSPRQGADVFVPTLHHQQFYHGGERAGLGAKWVHVEFQDYNGYTVLLILPTERHGLDALVSRLTTEALLDMFSHTGYKKVNLTLPKFNINMQVKLIPELRKLGLHSVFEDAADLSGISTQRLKVTDVIQKTEIAVDEHGVTASAATAVIMEPISAMYYPGAEKMDFTADHPFLAIIVDRQNSLPLFIGRVSNPLDN